MVYKRNPDSFAALTDVIARLRGDLGCPWDREQTPLSLKPNLLEECYEVIEAIDLGDSAKLSEELGDLLMIIVLIAQIAAEQGDFDIDKVIQGITAKLIHRHPHVFGEAKVKDAKEVASRWEELKKKERKGAPLLSGLPRGMPSLLYSHALQRRAARAGFDWENIDGVIDKVAEEVAELQQADNHRERVKEFGDLVFSLVNVARWIDVDLEEALRSANDKFYRRFGYMEEECRRRNIALDSLSFEEQNQLWEEAKRKVLSDEEDA